MKGSINNSDKINGLGQLIEIDSQLNADSALFMTGINFVIRR